MITRTKDLRWDQRGVTGLETAIILIAFVVVASVFAYTVLSAGIFSAEKGKEAIHAGLQQARSSIKLVGPVIAKDSNTDTDIDYIVFIIANVLDGEPVDLGITTISYIDQVQEVTDITYTRTSLGKDDGDDLLENDEKFEISVDVRSLATRLNEDDTFTLEVRPAKGSVLILERTTPGVIDKINDLN